MVDIQAPKVERGCFRRRGVHCSDHSVSNDHSEALLSRLERFESNYNGSYLGESRVFTAALLDVVDGHTAVGVSEVLSGHLLDLLIEAMLIWVMNPNYEW